MPVTFGGMASGLNTDDIIKKLVEVEARPIRQWEDEKATFNRRKEALGELRTRVNAVNAAAKDLYGFRASYADKSALSSNPGVIDASANRYAEKGVRRLEVLELASTHRLITDSLPDDQKFPEGKFKIEVNGVSKVVRFRGGTLKALQEAIDEAASDIVSTSYVNTNDNRHVLTLESKTSGKKGEINLSDGKDFLYAIGLVKGEKGEEKRKTSLVFDGKYFVPYAGAEPKTDDGSIDVDKDGKKISINGALWREYVLPAGVPAKKNTMLEFTVTHTPPEQEKDDTLPYRLEIGPDEKTVIKGIELHGYNVSRIRPLKKKEPKKELTDVLGVGVVAQDGEKRVEKLYPVDKKFKGKMEIPAGMDFDGKTITKVIFYGNEGVSEFSDAALFTPLDGKGLLDPKHEVAKAADARIKVDGIEVQRDKNEGLTDVVKGLTLNLRSKSDHPVTIKVEPSVDKALEKIKAFVEAYNNYLELNRLLIKTEKSEKPGDYKSHKYKNGLFVGDMTILRLENTLKETVGNAYPSRSEKPIKLITQMGISTGAINAAWESIREGKLVVDEGLLLSTLKDNPDGVEEFFGSDTDGDNRIDNGMAFRVETVLRPYVSSGKNIIANKMELEDTNIQMANSRIERHQEHLKKYEDKLRKKFSTMEQSISGAKSQGDWMKNQMKGMQGGTEEK